MHATTWAPGTNNELDQLFDELRERQYQDHTHRLWENYSKEKMGKSIALTIVFEDDNTPLVCGTIASRSWWPVNTYRIYNRMWKPNQRKEFLRRVTPSVGMLGVSQVNWLKENTTCDLYFISRETDNWQEWMIKHFLEYGLEFKTDKYKYLTCSKEILDSCWQHIIYNGNDRILAEWKHR